MLTRRLVLTKETLASLTCDELAAVAGGEATALTCGPTCPTCVVTTAIAASYVTPTNCCHTVGC